MVAREIKDPAMIIAIAQEPHAEAIHVLLILIVKILPEITAYVCNWMVTPTTVGHVGIRLGEVKITRQLEYRNQAPYIGITIL